MLNILLADDHMIVRQGLRSLLAQESDMTVVAEAGTGRATVELARIHRPHVVVMDISMPDMNGIDATRIIIEELSGVRVLAFSMESDRRFIVEVLKAGASVMFSRSRLLPNWPRQSVRWRPMRPTWDRASPISLFGNTCSVFPITSL